VRRKWLFRRRYLVISEAIRDPNSPFRSPKKPPDGTPKCSGSRGCCAAKFPASRADALVDSLPQSAPSPERRLFGSMVRRIAALPLPTG
jgi:hypothetical protein